MAVSRSFSQQVFAQLDLHPAGPSTQSQSPVPPSLVYSDHSPMHRPSHPARVLQPCRRSRAGSSSTSERSVHFSSVSTHPSLRVLPLPPRSASRASFRSISSIGSSIRLKLSNLRHSSHPAPPLPPSLTWARLREEYELHLARGSIIERCLVDVSVDPDNPALMRRWIDRVWRLADRLSPALPAALLNASADGLLPLLIPLRQSLDTLSDLLPFQPSHDQDHFTSLDAALSRASRFASLIEMVIETVGRAGLVRFELLITDPENWSGELRGKTGSGANWKGVIRRPK